MWGHLLPPFDWDEEEEANINQSQAQEAEVPRDKYLPGQEEVNRHMATDLPFRGLCERCVEQKDVGLPYQKGKGERERERDREVG